MVVNKCYMWYCCSYYLAEQQYYFSRLVIYAFICLSSVMQVPNPMASNSGYDPERQTKKREGRDIWPCIYLDFGSSPVADRDRLEPGRSVPKAPAVRPGLDIKSLMEAGHDHRWLAGSDSVLAVDDTGVWMSRLGDA